MKSYETYILIYAGIIYSTSNYIIKFCLIFVYTRNVLIFEVDLEFGNLLTSKFQRDDSESIVADRVYIQGVAPKMPRTVAPLSYNISKKV